MNILHWHITNLGSLVNSCVHYGVVLCCPERRYNMILDRLDEIKHKAYKELMDYDQKRDKSISKDEDPHYMYLLGKHSALEQIYGEMLVEHWDNIKQK